MPPKKKEEVKEAPPQPLDDAKFSYVEYGVPKYYVRLMINTTCRTDLLLNSIRSQILVSLTETIKSLAVSDGSDDRGNVIEAYSRFKEDLTAANPNCIELVDPFNGAIVNCQNNLTKFSQEILRARTVFKLAIVNEDKSLNVLWEGASQP